MYMCIYIYIYVHTHTVIYTCRHIRIYTHTHLLIHTYKHIQIYTRTHVRIHTYYTHTHLHKCTWHVYLCIPYTHDHMSTQAHIHINPSTHLYIYTHTHLHIYTSTHLHIYTSTHLYIYTITCTRKHSLTRSLTRSHSLTHTQSLTHSLTDWLRYPHTYILAYLLTCIHEYLIQKRRLLARVCTDLCTRAWLEVRQMARCQAVCRACRTPSKGDRRRRPADCQAPGSPPPSPSLCPPPCSSRASFQKFNLWKWGQPLGDLNFQRASWSEHKRWFWALRPSIWNFANRIYENWPCEHVHTTCHMRGTTQYRRRAVHDEHRL